MNNSGLEIEAAAERLGKLQARIARRCLLIGLLILICGAKMWLIHNYGNATPFSDEWDIDAPIIQGSLDGTLSPMQFFAAQNEHRIAFTRLLILMLFRAGKQWDPLLFMVAQAPLHALAITALVYLTGKSMSGLGLQALAGFAALLGIVPFGWESTLRGETSCFYFSILFGVVVIWLCWRCQPLAPRWWLGALLALASLFTMASGVFPIAAVTIFLTARLILERKQEYGRELAAICILGAIAAFGVAITPGSNHDLVATGLREYLSALTGILSWPCGFRWACCIIQAPLVLLTLLCLWRRISFTDSRWFPVIVAAGFWMQDGATAYSRSKGWDASRYADSWGMLLIAICACLYFLRAMLDGHFKWLMHAMTAVWVSTCFYGLLDHAMNILPRQLMTKKSSMMEMEYNVREYLRTGDLTYLNGRIPYPDAVALQKKISSNTLRSVLPTELLNPNPPLTPVLQQNFRDGFVQNGYPDGVPGLPETVYGSFGKDGVKSEGGISLRFNLPKGTDEVELQVAGYPSAGGMELRGKEGSSTYSIAPPINPGLLWQTIFFRVNPKSTSFKINATDRSEWTWLAFSAPKVSNRHTLGRWAAEAAGGFMVLFVTGLMLMVLGASMTSGWAHGFCGPARAAGPGAGIEES